MYVLQSSRSFQFICVTATERTSYRGSDIIVIDKKDININSVNINIDNINSNSNNINININMNNININNIKSNIAWTFLGLPRFSNPGGQPATEEHT